MGIKDNEDGFNLRVTSIVFEKLPGLLSRLDDVGLKIFYEDRRISPSPFLTKNAATALYD
jgi:hypothetical protein